MSSPFIFIATNRLKPGRLERERNRVPGLVEFIEASEPRMIAFNEFVNEAGDEATVVQFHPDAASMEAHMEIVRERAQEAYAETLDATVSRMTLVVKGDAFVVEQVIKQLHKLIDVIKVTDLSEENHVEREMLLIKVNAEPGARAEILRIGDIFRAKVVDVTPNTYTLEVTGEESKIEAIIELYRPFGIQELVRTGKVAIARGPKTRLRRVEEKLGKQRAAARPPEDPKVVGFAD